MEHMISRYHSYVYTIIVNMIGDYGSSAAEELTSDTFMAVWNHSEGIQSDKLKAYLCVTARNKAKDYLRLKHPLEMDIDEIEIPDSTESLDERLIRSERSKLVQNAIRRMKPKDREIFLRYYYYLQTTDQISSALGVSPSTVRSRLSRGRKLLQEILCKEDLP